MSNYVQLGQFWYTQMPVDYRIWGVIQERVYQKPMRDIDKLKWRLI